MTNKLAYDENFWGIKSDIVEARETMWRYYDRWPPLDNENELLYGKICSLNYYMWWMIGHHKDE